MVSVIALANSFSKTSNSKTPPALHPLPPARCQWFGEAEKFVKAVFSLASKISPCVIFIDEVDSMLGKRGKEAEHSAMRKVKCGEARAHGCSHDDGTMAFES